MGSKVLGWVIRYTVMEATGFSSNGFAGQAIDIFEMDHEEKKGVYVYQLTYTNKGIIVQVREGNKVLGYLG